MKHKISTGNYMMEKIATRRNSEIKHEVNCYLKKVSDNQRGRKNSPKNNLIEKKEKDKLEHVQMIKTKDKT